jgi:hypothetical protein
VLKGRTRSMRPKRAALYLRVSTGEQTTDNQRLALEAACEQRGWQVVTTYADPGISGAKGRDERPEFDRMLKHACARTVQRSHGLVRGSAWSITSGSD